MFQDGRDDFRHIPAVDRRRLRGAERQADRAVLRDRFGGPLREEEVLEEDRRPDVHHGQAGPVQRLLAQPVQALLEGVGHRSQAHLRDGQLGDVDEHFQVAAGACDGGGGNGRLQIGRRDAHAEIHTSAALQGTRDVRGAGEVADDDLGPGRTKCLGPVVVSPHESPDGQVAATEDLDDLSAHSAETPRGAGDENRCVDRHGCESTFKASPRGPVASRTDPAP